MKKLRTLLKSPNILLFVILVSVCLVLFFIHKCTQKSNKVENDDKCIYEKIKSTSYDDPNVDFTIYVDKFYRDLAFYGHYPIRPQEMIIKFADIDKINNTSNINAVSFGVGNDELVEITPDSIRLRTNILDPKLRYRENNKYE